MESYQLNIDGQASYVTPKKRIAPTIITKKTGHHRKIGFIVISAALLAGSYTIITHPSLQLNSLFEMDTMSATPTVVTKNTTPRMVTETTTPKTKPVKNTVVVPPQQITDIPAETPKYATLTKKLIISSIQTLSTKSALKPETTDEQWKTYILSKNDQVEKALQKLGIHSADRKVLLNNSAIAAQFNKLSKSTILRAQVKKGKLIELIVHKPTNKKSYVISQSGGNFLGSYQSKIIESHQLRDTLFITNSLRYNANQAKIPRSIINKLIAIFDRDVKLTRDLREGDRLTFVYTEIKHLGTKIMDGRVLAAELMHNKRSHRAISFRQNDGRQAFYDERGYDLSKAFIRRPIKNFRRISSGFGMRHHPIRQRRLMHTGVDFAAKRNTPINVTGNGIIQHIAPKGHYGKTIIVKHANGYTTRYAHMNGYKKGLKVGSKVYLGDIIGYVGSTGSSTGDHLHYEFRINGIPYNSEKVKLPQSLSLSKSERQRFKSSTHNLRRQLDVLQRFAEEKVDIDSAIGG
ncbi:MAG: M23 family metallopeptidase [Thiotrichaceae bacterium]|nr:M23 family metallopeptidase [Thiotrichaceae bacterium]